MQYSDGTTIVKSEKSPKGLRNLGKELKNSEKRLNSALIKDDDTFADLYDLCIAPCTEMMCELEGREWDNRELSLFYEGAEETACEQFLESFIRFILGRSPYNIKIWQMCPHEAICAAVEGELETVPFYVRLRVKVICILAGYVPEQVFAEGVNWFGAFLMDTAQNDFYEVSEGMTFPLILENPEGLYPRTLHNSGSQPCRIEVSYQSANYQICLPAHGILRVVFANQACDSLVNIKGNISFNSSDTRNAVIQMANPDQISNPNQTALYMYHKQYREPFELETRGAFVDASADGKGGAAVLTRSGLYFTRNDRLEKNEKLPIRVYGAGTLWARQYGDGSLECNIHKRGGQPMNLAISVVENKDRSIMIVDEDGAWDCVGGVAREITRDQFVQCMMERFSKDGVCESAGSSLMRLHIRYDGMLEAE